MLDHIKFVLQLHVKILVQQILNTHILQTRLLLLVLNYLIPLLVKKLFLKIRPPEIRKLSFSTSGSGDVSGKVLESNTASEISNLEDLDTATINLNGESIIVQFTESMNTQSITVNTTDTLLWRCNSNEL